jgi:hypothetical protein
VGVIAAAPLLIAFIGDRITTIKGFGVEVSLSQVTVDVAGDNSAVAPDLSDAVMPSQEPEGSQAADLASPFTSLIEEQSKLLRINLRNGQYWWSTRIFLVAAIAQDFTNVKAIVFVQRGDEQLFVGITTPRAVRARLCAIFPIYEVAYRIARSASAAEALNDADGKESAQILHALQPVLGQVRQPTHEVVDILQRRWEDALAALNQPEYEIQQAVGSNEIQEWLRGDLDTKSFSDGPLTTLQQYRIISHDQRYAALTDDRGRLDSVVGRDELAVMLSTGYLEKKLDRL